MRKTIFISSILLITGQTLFAQDYFSDRNGNGSPILLKDRGDKTTLLFSANVDVSDQSSLKGNFYSQYRVDSKDYDGTKWPRSKHFLGWGVNFKGSTTNGTGALFQSGNFTPGFTGGAYLAYTNMRWWKKHDSDECFSTWAIILSGSLSYANEQFFDSTQSFDKQLSSQTFQGNKISLSAVWRPSSNSDNFYLGASISAEKIDNYSSLDIVTIQDNTMINGTGAVRNVTPVNPDGNTYATGVYQSYTNYDLRINMTYVPAALSYNFGFTFYPSLDLSSAYSPRYNLGLAASYLKAGSPSIPVASIFFELNDMNNAAASDKPFIKRSFKIGVATALNLLTGDKKNE